MDSKQLLNSITESFYADNASHISFVSLPENLMNSYKDIVSDDVQIIDLQTETTPLAPFLKICADMNLPYEYVLENTYSLQTDTFLSFLTNGFPNERLDPIIIEEIDYEKLRARETIIQFLRDYFTGKIIVLNAQNMSENALDILNSLLTEENFKGKLIFCFNSMEMEVLSIEIRNFLQTVCNSPNYYSINTLEDINFLKKKSRKASKPNFKSIFNQLRSYRAFLDIGKAYELTKKIEASNVLLDASLNDARLIYIEMGIISFFYGDNDLATFFLSNIVESQIEDSVECWALYFMAYVASRKNMTTLAIRYIKKAIAKSKIIDDQRLFALASMLEYIITEREDSEYSTQKYFNVLNLLKEQNLINNKIFTSLIIPYGIMYNKELRKKMLVQVENAMKEAESIKNKFGLSTDYHWMGIMMTHEGNKEKALKWYNKSFKLRKEIGDITSIIKVSNGLSYEHLIDTKFKISYEIINNVIHYLLDSNDYAEVLITLFNLERSCFYSRNFELSYQIINTILTLISLFDISDLASNSFLPEYNDILIYKAYLDFSSGELTRAKMNLHNIVNNGKNMAQIETFLRDFLRVCFEVEENNLEEAKKIFEELEKSFFGVGVSQEFRIVFMYYELALLLDKKGFKKESDYYWEKGLQLAKEKKLSYYTKDKDNISLKEYLDSTEKFPDLKIDFEALLEKAEKEQLVNQLHKRLKDSQFLNKLTASHVNSISDTRFVSNIVQAVFDYCMADGVFLAQKSEDGWKLLDNAVRENMDPPENSLWNRILNSKKTVNKEEEPDTEREIICINLSKFEFTGGIVIYLQKKYQISPEEMNILNIAANNIQALFVMLKQNEHLSIISATDQLSMLNNRRALQNHLNLESEMIRRYEKKRNLHMHDSISFIDLDNFKYYNDTFGHEAGDLLISCFAKLLKRIYRKVDFIARFGGDEFVIVLPNTSSQEAKRAAERLYEGLEASRFFIPELQNLIDKNIFIPDEKLLGFSMGISENTDEEDTSNLDCAMANADKALYYSKQHKKGSVTIWSDIKEQYKEMKIPERKE